MKGKKIEYEEVENLKEDIKVIIAYEGEEVLAEIKLHPFISCSGDECRPCNRAAFRYFSPMKNGTTWASGVIGTIYEYENDIKEYTTSEVLGMLTENQELRFRTRIGEIGFEANSDRFYCVKEVLWSASKTKFQVDTETLKYMWEEIKPEPVEVSFMEAAQAYLEGKTIYCEDNKKNINKYCKPKFGIGMKDADGYALTAEEILENKWFVL
jgi:hypothetical protein